MSTYTCLKYHIVFSTKRRQPLIKPEWQERLHRYLAGAVERQGGVTSAVGGIEDHVHLLTGFGPTHCLSDVVRDIKKSSSRWIHEELNVPQFAWQEGYGAFSVSFEGISTVTAYIAHQREHHAKMNSHDEMLALLAEAGIEPDMRYFE